MSIIIFLSKEVEKKNYTTFLYTSEIIFLLISTWYVLCNMYDSLCMRLFWSYNFFMEFLHWPTGFSRILRGFFRFTKVWIIDEFE